MRKIWTLIKLHTNNVSTRIKLQSESPTVGQIDARVSSFSQIELFVSISLTIVAFVTIPLRGSIKTIFLPVNSTQNKTFVGLTLGASISLNSWKCDLCSLLYKISNCPMLDMSSKVANANLNDEFKIQWFLFLSLSLEVERVSSQNLFSPLKP